MTLLAALFTLEELNELDEKKLHILKHLIEKEILKQSAIRVEIFPVFSRTAGNFGHRFVRLSSRDLERSAVPG